MDRTAAPTPERLDPDDLRLALAPPRPAEPEPRRFTADEVLRMYEAGVFRPDERLELLEGELIRVAAQGTPHALAVARLMRWAVLGTEGRPWIVWPSSTVRVADDSLPEPDLAIVRRDPYPRHPEPQDIALVIEVSDSTVWQDRVRKARLYGRRGLREYWQVDLPAQLVRVFRRPGPEGYLQMRELRRGETLTPLFRRGMPISVDQVLGPPPGGGRRARSRTPRPRSGAPRRPGPRAHGA